MKISDFLSPAHVMIDVRARDKSRLLEQLSTQAADEVGLAADEVATEIAKREELGSTGVGNGVALPHTRLQGLEAPFGLLARLRHGIDFDAIDGEPVDIVFFLLLPDAADGPKGNALACVARALRDPETLWKLRSAPNRETLFRAVAAPQKRLRSCQLLARSGLCLGRRPRLPLTHRSTGLRLAPDFRTATDPYSVGTKQMPSALIPTSDPWPKCAAVHRGVE
jgi:nitrogen PTS system EIIA component